MYKGGNFMGKQIEKIHDEFCELMRKNDEALLDLLKLGHRELITTIIKDYLQQHES